MQANVLSFALHSACLLLCAFCMQRNNLILSRITAGTSARKRGWHHGQPGWKVATHRAEEVARAG